MLDWISKKVVISLLFNEVLDELNSSRVKQLKTKFAIGSERIICICDLNEKKMFNRFEMKTMNNFVLFSDARHKNFTKKGKSF